MLMNGGFSSERMPSLRGPPERKSPSGTEWIEKSVLQSELRTRGSSWSDGSSGGSSLPGAPVTDSDPLVLPQAMAMTARATRVVNVNRLVICMLNSG